MKALLWFALVFPLAAQTGPAKFLIATPKLDNTEFAHTVILLLQSDRQSAMGLVINQAAPVRLPKYGDMPIFLGGPVRMGINALVRAASKPDGSSLVFADVYLLSSDVAIRKAIDTSSKQLRIYIGLSSWAGAQLRSEIGSGSWRLMDAQVDAIFDSRPKSLWQRLSK